MNKKTVVPKWLVIITVILAALYIIGNYFAIISGIFEYITNLLMPLILGLIFAMILNVPMSSVESHLWQGSNKKFACTARRPVALILSVLIILGVLVGVVILVIPQTIEAGTIIAENISDSLHDLADIEKRIENNKLFGNIDIDWDIVYSSFDSFVRESGIDIVGSAIEKIGVFIFGVVDIVVAVVISVYILLTKEKLKIQSKRVLCAWLPDRVTNGLLCVCSTFSRVFKNFVAGQSLEALILGALCTLGMFILRIPYALTVGVLVAVTAYIPVVGAFFGAFIGAFMIFSVSPLKALIFIIFIIVLQQIEGNLIYPKLMGSRVDLPALWVLIAITLGGSLGGVAGMLFAVPLASTAYILFKESIFKREEMKRSVSDEIDSSNESDEGKNEITK